jgi:hypothetical protein
MKKILIITLFSALLTGCYQTENGEKLGSIVKFAKEGVIFGTYEAEIIRGNLNEGSGSFGKSFHFTVEGKHLIDKVKNLMSNGKQVKINYHKDLITRPFRCESDNYFLDNIDIIN